MTDRELVALMTSILYAGSPKFDDRKELVRIACCVLNEVDHLLDSGEATTKFSQAYTKQEKPRRKSNMWLYPSKHRPIT